VEASASGRPILSASSSFLVSVAGVENSRQPRPEKFFYTMSRENREYTRRDAVLILWKIIKF
jgi:hypothetical protein